MVALSIARAAESAHIAAPGRIGAVTEDTGADSVVTGADAHAVQATRTRMSFVIGGAGESIACEANSGPVEVTKWVQWMSCLLGPLLFE